VKVLPRFNCQKTSVINQILNDPGTRARWLDQIVGTVQQYGYDGINLDFEAGLATDRGAYSSFFTELAQRLHAQGKLLSVAVSSKTREVANHPRSTFFDYNALAQNADYVFVMAWGVHWAASAPGSQDDITYWRSVVDYVSTMPNSGRFVMGTQLYGMDWANGGGSANRAATYEYSDVQALASRVGATPRLDAVTDSMTFSYQDSNGSPHEVWYSDASTTRDRLQVARDHGLGFGFWRLGNEDQRLWDDPLLVP
jgi:spore germination protein